MTNKPQFVGEKQPLENRVDYVRGVTYKAAVDLHEELNSSSYVLLRANNIQDGELKFDDVQYVDRTKVKPKQLLRRGDILLCASSGSKGLVGKAALVRENMLVTFGAFCCVLRPKENEAEYLGHYFQSQQYRRAIEKVCSGSNINNLKAANFLSLVVQGRVVPSYDDDSTRAISALFDSIDAQIKQARDQIANLDSLVKSRFVEMFGDPCDPGSSSAKIRIDSFCELRIGPFGSALHKEDYITGGHPLVNPSHIIGGAIRPDENLTIDDGKYESLASYHLLPGDVVLGRRGEIGRCAVVKADGLICGTGSMIIRPGQKVRSDYLQRVVSFPSFSHALEANAVGVTMKNLNAIIVGSAEIFLPDLKDQDACITLVSQIDKSKYNYSSSSLFLGI